MVPRATERPQSHFLLLLPQSPFGNPSGLVGASHQGQDLFTIHAQASRVGTGIRPPPASLCGVLGAMARQRRVPGLGHRVPLGGSAGSPPCKEVC